MREERGIVRPLIAVLTAVPWAVAAAAAEASEDLRPHLTAAGLRARTWLREVANGG